MAYFPQSKLPVSALAMTSVVMAAASVVLFCVGPLLSIPAVIMGFLALKATGGEAPQRRGRGLAIGGVILGFVSLLISAAGVAAVVVWPESVAGWAPFGQMEGLANRAADANNVVTILKESRGYATSNGGAMPPHLAAIAPRLGDPTVLVSRSGKTEAMKAFAAAANWQDWAADVDAHCDYNYVGADVTLTGLSDPGSVVVIYSKDVYPDHGRLFGFADGHVTWAPETEVASVLEQSNHVRAGAGLARLMLDGPAPLPKVKPVARTSTRQASPEVHAPTAGPVKSIGDAIGALKASTLERRREGITFLETAPPDDQYRREVSQLLESLVPEPELRLAALSALKTWGTKENVPGLVHRLSTLKNSEVSEMNATIAALGGTGDVAGTSDLLAKLLLTDHRRSAADALIALGSETEGAVVPYIENKDVNVSREACRVLGQIGTAKSLPALKAVNARSTPQKREADGAVKLIEARLQGGG